MIVEERGQFPLLEQRFEQIEARVEISLTAEDEPRGLVAQHDVPRVVEHEGRRMAEREHDAAQRRRHLFAQFDFFLSRKIM